MSNGRGFGHLTTSSRKFQTMQKVPDFYTYIYIQNRSYKSQLTVTGTALLIMHTLLSPGFSTAG